MVLVELGSRVVDRVDDHEPRGDGFCGHHDARECVGEQRPTEPPALQRSIERKPPEQHGWDLPGSAPTQTRGQVIALEQMRGERVVGNDPAVTLVPDEAARRPPRLAVKSVLLQPARA